MKNLKKVLSVVLAVAMLACSMAIAATTASAEDNYTTIQSWGINEFNNFEGSGLTSDAANEVLPRDKSVGITGLGVWGYISSGTTAEIVGGTTYNYHLYLDWDGVEHANTTEIGIDCWVADYNDGPTYSAGISTDAIKEAYNNALENGFSYTDDGNRYFEVDGYLTIPEECNGYSGEFRVYTRGFINYRVYTFELYGDDVFTPIATVDSGESNPHNDESGIRFEPYLENSNYTLPRGFRVLRGDYTEEKLALGGTSKELAAGSYAAQYDLFFDGVYCGDEDVLATAKVKNAAGDVVATKDIKKGDITRTIIDSANGNTTGGFLDGTASVLVPFTAEDGTYTIELYTTGKANVTVTSAGIAAVIPADEIEKVEKLIDAIGDVKYDPDVNEDSKEAIDAARTAYDALAAKYGDVSDVVSNSAVLTAAETAYQGKVSEYNDMVDAAKLVDEAISAIPTPITLECDEYIEAAEAARDSFIETYSQAKADLHITKLADLAKAREDFDKLAKEKINYGDVDGDEKVTANDALEALQASIGARELDEKATKAADVDKDEKVTANDALCILQFTVGARETLPVE